MVKERDRKVISKTIQRYLKVLKENKINFKKVYLYGSCVRGDFTNDSDIDLAIVSDEFTGDFIDDGLLLMRLRRQVDSRIEPHPFLSDDFTPDNPFVKHIIETGEEIEFKE